MEEVNFLGRGWAFPPEFNRADKQVNLIEHEDDIKNSLEILLSTRVGERIMQPEYGCNLEVMLFENNTLSLQTIIKDMVFKAVYFFEPRVIPRELNFETIPEEGVVFLELEYSIISTNTRHNLVYPFYLNESKVSV